MTNLRQAAQQALETLEGWDNYGAWVWPESALEQSKRNTTDSIATLKAALKQPEQGPVAVHQWRNPVCADWYDGHPDYCDGDGPYETRTLYTAPPAAQRPWQGLTDEDRRKFAAAQYGWEDLLIAAEAKLKERNT